MSNGFVYTVKRLWASIFKLDKLVALNSCNTVTDMCEQIPKCFIYIDVDNYASIAGQQYRVTTRFGSVEELLNFLDTSVTSVRNKEAISNRTFNSMLDKPITITFDEWLTTIDGYEININWLWSKFSNIITELNTALKDVHLHRPDRVVYYERKLKIVLLELSTITGALLEVTTTR